jgi:glucosylceramidase
MLAISALVALLAAVPAGASARVRVWLTTGDQRNLLAEQPRSAIGAPASGAPTIAIDPARRYQRIEGFGASITDSSAKAARLVAAPADDHGSLFDPRRGLGLSYLRQPMGASDFVARPPLHVRRRSPEILPLLRRARALNPRLRMMATPWSPPAWMKTGGSLVGGRVIDDPLVYRAYARYFVRFVRAYRRSCDPAP